MSGHETRRRMILTIVASGSVRTQEDLVEALADQGIEASQASVSRDVASLGLVKSGGRYALPRGPASNGDPLQARLRNNLLEIRPAGVNLLVLFTPPGEASGVAFAIDRMAPPGVVGTVAGDDTIFVAVTGGRAGRDLARRLRNIAGMADSGSA